jgi:capsular polysaccharide biosynthesis protein
MLDSKPIATDALGLARVPRTPDQLVKATKVTPVTDTQLLDVTVTDRDRQAAQRLANGVSDAFIKRITIIDSTPAPGALPSAPAYIFQRADLPEHRDASGLLRNLLLAGFFGLLLSIGVVLLLDQLDVTLKTPGEAERRLQLPVLGFIPYNSLHAAGVLTPVADIREAGPEPRSRPGIGA